MTRGTVVVIGGGLAGVTAALRCAESGFDVTVVSTFEDAKRRLSTGQPLALLITDVRLGPYNGFHLDWLPP